MKYQVALSAPYPNVENVRKNPMDAKKLMNSFEEHITEISKMARLLDEGDPKMTTMIETYRRGFFKGIAASTQNMFNNH